MSRVKVTRYKKLKGRLIFTKRPMRYGLSRVWKGHASLEIPTIKRKKRTTTGEPRENFVAVDTVLS